MTEVESTFSSDKSSITSLGSGTIELTLGGTEGEWTLTSSNGKLGATAVKKLAWDGGTQTWSISISSGDATIQNGTDSYGRFLHNTGSTRFTTYTSSPSVSMLLPQLYRKSAGVTYSDYTTTCVVCALASISLNTDADNEPTTFAVTGNAPKLLPASGTWHLDNPFVNSDGSPAVITLEGGQRLTVTAVPGATSTLEFKLTRTSGGNPFVSYVYNLAPAN